MGKCLSLLIIFLLNTISHALTSVSEDKLNRVLCFASSGDVVSARKDVQTPYHITNDLEMEQTL